MRDAAAAAGVSIVTGDTRVVQRGKADGCYVNTAGIGVIGFNVSLGVARAEPDDAIIVSGPMWACWSARTTSRCAPRSATRASCSALTRCT